MVVSSGAGPDAPKLPCATTTSTRCHMDLFTLLGPLDPDVTPDRCKLHLATWNGLHDPLDLYLQGVFDEWQSDQNRRNFSRCDFIVALIAMPEPDLWLFAGVHSVLGEEPRAGEDRVHYRTSRRAACDELDGRLVVAFKRTSRQPYPFAEKLASQLTVHAIRPGKQEITEFPGYRSVRLTKHQLDRIVNARSGTWRSALSGVRGVYVIADAETGKLYVGSATGEEGLWGRWCEYSAKGHGGNQRLRQLIRDHGDARLEHLHFGILEVADSNAGVDDIIEREQHWKALLHTRKHGYNDN